MPNGDIGPEMGAPPQPPGAEQKEPFGVTPEAPGKYQEPLWTELIRAAEREEQIRWVARKAISEMEEEEDYCDYYTVSAILGGLKNRRYRIDAKELFGEERGLNDQDRSMRDELKRLEKEVKARQRIQNAHALERKYAGSIEQYADMFLEPGKINFKAVDMKFIGRAPETGIEQKEKFGVMLDEAMRGYIIVALADTARRIERLASNEKRKDGETIRKTQGELEINRKKINFIKKILRDNFGSDDIQEILKNSTTEIDFGDPKEGGFGKRRIKLQEIFQKAVSEKMPSAFTGNLQDEDYEKTREFIIQELGVSREVAVLAFNLFRVLNLATIFDADISGMPTSNDLIKMAHFEYKRAKEHAELKPSEAPFPAGPPSTLSKYPDLITDFLHFTGVKKEKDPEGNPKTLWQLWWHEGRGFGFLPWEESGGVTKENFDFYRYVCWRAKNVYEDLVKKKDLRKFIEEGGFRPRNKNFDIAFNDRKGETGKVKYEKPEENPRVQYIIGMVYEHHPRGYRTPEDAKKSKESIPVVERWNYLTAHQVGKLRDEREATEAATKSVIFFLTLAVNNGFITKEERKFIEKYCEIEPGFFGLRW